MIRALLWVVGRRFAAIVPVFLVVTILVFVTLRLLPVDPAKMSLPASATIEQVDAKRISMGLNLPIWQQYRLWLDDALQGDFGESAQYRMDTLGVVMDRLPATIELAVCALIFALLVGIGAGLLIFSVRGTPLETAGLVTTSGMMALPDFLLALLLILLFGVLVPVFPVNGRLDPGIVQPTGTGFLLIDSLVAGNLSVFRNVLAHMALPVVALGVAFAPLIIRVLHSSLIATYQESYIKQARLRGLSDRAILFGEACKNAMLPVVILVGTQFGSLFGGTLLVEMIFSYPGIGNLMLKAMQSVDLNVIQLVALIYCGITLLFNSLADAAAYAMNPKLRA